jgi:hypothetical protein
VHIAQTLTGTGNGDYGPRMGGLVNQPDVEAEKLVRVAPPNRSPRDPSLRRSGVGARPRRGRSGRGWDQLGVSSPPAALCLLPLPNAWLEAGDPPLRAQIRLRTRAPYRGL